MADEEGKEDPPRGNEWEVVSLTASAYAAAPGPQQVDHNEGSQVKLDSKQEAESSSPLFMSRHFVFPPSQHENLPLEPEYNETLYKKEIEDVISQLVQEEEADKLDTKDDETVDFKGLISDEFPGIPIFDDKGNFGNDVAQSIYSSTTEFSSFRNDAGEGDDLTGPNLDSADNSRLQDFEKHVEGDEHDGIDLPCEAWWKRRAVKLYAHAKEANTFWSIFVAAAVMGLVIIGHQWQQERWKVLHLRQFGINDERMGRMLGPISRFKDVIVGGHRRGSLVRGGALQNVKVLTTS